jgi:hypothetical protein
MSTRGALLIERFIIGMRPPERLPNVERDSDGSNYLIESHRRFGKPFFSDLSSVRVSAALPDGFE